MWRNIHVHVNQSNVSGYTRAPASWHTLATARSRGRAPDASTPEVAQYGRLVGQSIHGWRTCAERPAGGRMRPRGLERQKLLRRSMTLLPQRLAHLPLQYGVSRGALHSRCRPCCLLGILGGLLADHSSTGQVGSRSFGPHTAVLDRDCCASQPPASASTAATLLPGIR